MMYDAKLGDVGAEGEMLTMIINREDGPGEITVTADEAGAVLKMTMDHHRISAVLATFAMSPVSMSSLQPVLDLARELNPELPCWR